MTILIILLNYNSVILCHFVLSYNSVKIIIRCLMTKERFFVIYKTCSPCGSSRIQKGGMGVEDKEFQELFQRIVDQYELAPDIAEELLQRILNILSYCDPADEEP